MKFKHGKPSFIRIILLDAWAAGAILYLIILWATHFYMSATLDPLSASYTIPFSLKVVLGATGLTVLILIWRFRFYRRIFSTGIKVLGYVSGNYDFIQQAGNYPIRRVQVEFLYVYEGIMYKRKVDIFTPWLKLLPVGREVDIIVDPQKPKRAFIKILYL